VIRADAADLEELRRLVEAEIGPEARLFPVTSAAGGELREPILIGLIVALGGPAITKAIAGVIKRYLEHKETMAKLDNERHASDNGFRLRLALQNAAGDERPVTLPELAAAQP
jgi:hypothetical protein